LGSDICQREGASGGGRNAEGVSDGEPKRKKKEKYKRGREKQSERERQQPTGKETVTERKKEATIESGGETE
jgi:hypothetical protein